MNEKNNVSAGHYISTDLRRIIEVLRSSADYVKLEADEPCQTESGPIGIEDFALVQTLGARFHESIASLERHPHGGTLFAIKNEWDCQYLFRAMAPQFLTAPEFTQKYGASPTNESYASALYTNVLGRAPDAAGLAFWVDQLAHGVGRDEMLVNFAQSAENLNITGSHTANGFWVTG